MALSHVPRLKDVAKAANVSLAAASRILRGDLRHFYFDFEEIAPGPLLRTPDEVVDALGGLDRVTDGYRGRYDRFRARFCSREDGSATDRVLALVVPGDPAG